MSTPTQVTGLPAARRRVHPGARRTQNRVEPQRRGPRRSAWGVQPWRRPAGRPVVWRRWRDRRRAWPHPGSRGGSPQPGGSAGASHWSRRPRCHPGRQTEPGHGRKPPPVNCPAAAIEASGLGYRCGHAISRVLVPGRADAYQWCPSRQGHPGRHRHPGRQGAAPFGGPGRQTAPHVRLLTIKTIPMGRQWGDVGQV